jgi:PadR family transcriptional regulator PadR
MASFVDPSSAILQALLQGDSFGLEIIDCVEQLTRGKLRLRQGSVYPALRALEQQGLLEHYDPKPRAKGGGRPRRYYRITAQGRRVAQEQAAAAFALFTPALGTA